jgi:multidrug efflux system membrane fusion protein
MGRALAVVAIGLLVLAGVGCKRTGPTAAPAAPVRIQAAEVAPAPNSLRYSATIQPVTQINLSFKVGGYVAEILQVPDAKRGRHALQEGDRVSAGAVIASVQTRDYQVQVDNAQAQVNEASAGRVQAEAQLRSAQVTLPQAEAQLAVAQATFDKAQRDWARAAALYAARSLTRPDYDAAQAGFSTATATLSSARAGVEAARAQIVNAEAMLSQTGAKVASARQQLAAQQIPLSDTALRTPADVVILSRKIEVGTFVQPGTVGFIVATTDPVKAVFSAPDTVIRKLRLGQVLPVGSEEAGPDSQWRGPITAIAPSADAQTRVYQVEITLPNPRGSLLLGMIVSVRVGAEAPPSAFPAVPLTAVVRPAGASAGYAVFVVDGKDGTLIARRREVGLGEVLGNLIVVRDGLRIGEQVVVSGATIVTDGQVVKALP